MVYWILKMISHCIVITIESMRWTNGIEDYEKCVQLLINYINQSSPNYTQNAEDSLEFIVANK